MKKVGTLTTALSLIFLGVVMLLRQVDPILARDILEFWPAIFIILGLEVILFYSSKKNEGKRLGFNFGVIFMVIIFLVTEGCYGLGENLNGFFKGFNINFDAGVGKSIDITQDIEVKSSNLTFRTANASIKIKKSDSDKAKFEGKIYVRENYGIDKYELKPSSDDNSTEININESYVKKVEGVLYIPSNLSNLYLDVNNINFETLDKFNSTNLKIDNNNGKFNISNFATVLLDNNNGNIDINDSKEVKIKSNNSKMILKGEIENIDVETNISSVDISNNICKDVRVISDSGKVDLKTNSSNISIDAATDTGTIYINGEKITGKSVKNQDSKEEGKVYIRTDVGSIRIEHKNKE